MKTRKLLYNFAITLQVMVFTMECISFLFLLLLNPGYFKSFIVNSRIDLNVFNMLFFRILSVFQGTGVRVISGGLLLIFFAAVLIYFLIFRKIWDKPDNNSLYFTGIVLATTVFFCFVVLNFWQFYSNFM